jgi:hypothetical protein
MTAIFLPIAYIDPVSGVILIQIVLGALLGCLFRFHGILAKLFSSLFRMRVFASKHGTTDATASPENPSGTFSESEATVLSFSESPDERRPSSEGENKKAA